MRFAHFCAKSGLGRTSKTCAHCGGVAVVDEDNSRIVRCSNDECGAVEDRELNAAAVCYRNAILRIAEIDRMYRDGSEREAAKFSERKAKQVARQIARWRDKNGTEPEQDRADLREPEVVVLSGEVRTEDVPAVSESLEENSV